MPEAWTSQPADDCIAPGTSLRLTALAEYHGPVPPDYIIIGNDFYFSHWEDEEGNILSTETSVVIIMDRSRRVEAVYDQIW